jgi:hypothetical protein
MPDESTAQVWLYDGETWSLAPDPIEWIGDGDDVYERYQAAGYGLRADLGGAAPFLRLGVTDEVAGSGVAALSLWVRPGKPPECLIGIDGTDDSGHAVFAARLPDGLDLLARWTPIVQANVLLDLICQVQERKIDRSGKPDRPPGGLVESVVVRALRAIRRNDMGAP